MSEAGPGADQPPANQPRGEQPPGKPVQGDGTPNRVEVVHPKVEAVPREARAFQGQRAGVVTRTVANTLDFLLVVGVIACGYAAWCALTFLISPTRFSFPTVSFLALLICAGILMFTYFTLTWATTGRTVGDKQMGLRVVNLHGERLGWPGSALRAAFCVLLPIGLYWAIFSPTNRSVQDSVLRTSVIYDWTVRRSPPPRLTQQG